MPARKRHSPSLLRRARLPRGHPERLTRANAKTLAERSAAYRAESERISLRRQPGATVRSTRGHGTTLRRDSWFALSSRDRASRQRAVEAVALMRKEGISASLAARRTGSTTDAMIRWTGDRLERTSSGRLILRPHDQGMRIMPVIAEEGIIPAVGVAGGDDAAVVAGHLDAIADALAGDPTALDPFRGVVLLVQLEDGRWVEVTLLTDIDELGYLYSVGGLDDLVVIS